MLPKRPNVSGGPIYLHRIIRHTLATVVPGNRSMSTTQTKSKTGKTNAGKTKSTGGKETPQQRIKKAWWFYTQWDSDTRTKVINYLIDGSDADVLLGDLPKPDAKSAFYKKTYGSIEVANPKDAKRLLDSLKITNAPEGYYQRLADVVHAGKLTSSQVQSDKRVPAYIVRLAKFDRFIQQYYNHIKPPISAWLKDLDTDGKHSEAKVVQCMVEIDRYSYSSIAHYLRHCSGVSSLLARHPDVVSERLTSGKADSVRELLAYLTQQKFDFATIVPALVELALGSSKRLRPIAAGHVRDHREVAMPLVAEMLTGGSASQRGHAAELLPAVDDDAVEKLKAASKTEKAARTKQTIAAAIQTASLQTEPDRVVEFDLPAVDVAEGHIAVPDGWADRAFAALQKTHDKEIKQTERMLSSAEDYWRKHAKRELKKLKDNPPAIKQRDIYIAYIESGGKLPSQDYWWTQNLIPALGSTLLKELQLVHLIRLLILTNDLPRSKDRESTVTIHNDHWVNAHRRAQEQPYDLRTFAHQYAAETDIDVETFARSHLQYGGTWYGSFDWGGDAVWTLHAEHVDGLGEALRSTVDSYDDNRRANAIAVSAGLPELPPSIEADLWSIALGESKTHRPAARNALSRVEHRTQRCLAVLGDGRQAIRLAAAEFLAELADPEAAGPLKKAVTGEKQDVVKGTMLIALERCGGDMEEFLGRRKQLLDAKKVLEKKPPKGMEWLDLNRLPKVRWADDDKPVHQSIVQAWVIQSIQFKQLEPGAVLSRSLDMCRTDDTANLAEHLLSAFIAQDTRTRPHADIVAEATKQAKQIYSRNKRYYDSEEALRELLIQNKQTEFLGSAIAQKGLLAIVAQAGDTRCVPIAERYIRKYHGQRLSQSKAMLEVLGMMDDPKAIQVLLALSTRFRTKAIQKRAGDLIAEIAARRHWTRDELADRTIPDGGFVRPVNNDDEPTGEPARMTLDYGGRSFTVVLDDDLSPVITRDDGKTVKSLPAAAKDDDAEKVKAAKKTFSAAKKTIKELVKSQASRLYDAACTQRQWPVDDWETYLVTHPIMGALCRRIVWVVKPPSDEASILFRPLEDGTYTDVDDNPVTLPVGGIITVAHGSLIDDQQVAAWREHLVDYEVPSLFDQFGRETYRLSSTDKDKEKIDAFEGHMLTTFILRSNANRLGWQRGEIIDGGGFENYVKTFPSQNLRAEIYFTGSYVPEEDLSAAIRHLSFTKIKADDDERQNRWYAPAIPLSDVPPILLSECYNDVKQIAAAGTGFDAEWEKKGLW